MPIARFRSLEDAHAATLRGDLSGRPLAERIAGLLALSSALAPYPPPCGVIRFLSIEEANRHRASWEKERAAALRARVVAE